MTPPLPEDLRHRQGVGGDCTAVDAALRRYKPCATPHECFGARIQHDLRHWQGGIRREAFAAAV